MRGPESHDLFHCLDEAEGSLVGKDGHSDDIVSELNEMANETSPSDSHRPRIVGKGLCMPKDFQKLGKKASLVYFAKCTSPFFGVLSRMIRGE